MFHILLLILKATVWFSPRRYNVKTIKLLFFTIATSLLFCLFIPVESKAASKELTGKISISYSSSTGKLTAIYDGDIELSGAEIYTWYKDGSIVSNGKTYSPSVAGTYYCTLRDNSGYDGTLTSKTIELYKVSGSNLTLDNSYGIYEVESEVTVSANLNENQVVTNWKTSAAGVSIPATGQTVTFRMPAQNVTVTATIKNEYSIKVYGGTADTYTAYTGETVTITASDVNGKKFVSWSASGGKLGDSKSPTTTLTVGNGNVVVTANFSGETSTINNASPVSSSSTGIADAKHAVYSVLDNQGHSIQFFHHEQGPLCDAAFKYAQGYDWLVTDYFNLLIDNSYSTYEIATPIKIQVTIPSDLVKSDRHWRMVCVSRNGQIYSFEDEDSSDSTITFSPNKFYAFAMCYNDIQPSYEETIPEESAESETTEKEPTSAVQSVTNSKTQASSIHSADASVTTNTTGVATAAVKEGSRIKSDQDAAVERANGASVALISM